VWFSSVVLLALNLSKCDVLYDDVAVYQRVVLHSILIASQLVHSAPVSMLACTNGL